MTCKEIVRRLSELLDGGVDAATLERLNQHLKDCDSCRWVVDSTRKTIHFYCNSDPLPLPEDVQSRLNRALAERLSRTP
ncbi:MAG: zf-HC2 domain-containing protein [Acidobacteria bacterium]|nr:zf-HC2 domain-containing protein [Acidobacteriota bacterium]